MNATEIKVLDFIAQNNAFPPRSVALVDELGKLGLLPRDDRDSGYEPRLTEAGWDVWAEEVLSKIADPLTLLPPKIAEAVRTICESLHLANHHSNFREAASLWNQSSKAGKLIADWEDDHPELANYIGRSPLRYPADSNPRKVA